MKKKGERKGRKECVQWHGPMCLGYVDLAELAGPADRHYQLRIYILNERTSRAERNCAERAMSSVPWADLAVHTIDNVQHTANWGCYAS